MNEYERKVKDLLDFYKDENIVGTAGESLYLLK